METVRCRGRLIVTHEALRRALWLPETARIIAVLQGSDALCAGTFDVLVEDDSMPICLEGAAVPRKPASGDLRPSWLRLAKYW